MADSPDLDLQVQGRGKFVGPAFWATTVGTLGSPGSSGPLLPIAAFLRALAVTP